MARAQCRLAKAVEAAETAAALLWREKADLRLPVLLPDGSYRSVLVSPKGKGKTRTQLIEASPAAEGPGTRARPATPRQDLPEGRQARPPQLLPRQETRRPSYPARRPGHDQAGQLQLAQPPHGHRYSHTSLLGVLSGTDLRAAHRRALKTVKVHAQALSRR